MKTKITAAVAALALAGGIAALEISSPPKVGPNTCTTRSRDGKNTLIVLGDMSVADCLKATLEANK